MEQQPGKTSVGGLTRRQFVRAAGIAAAGVFVGSAGESPVYAVAPSRAVGANERIGVAFIGVGGMGTYHLKSVSRRLDEMNVDIVGVCDVWDKRLSAAKGIAGLPDSKGHRDYRKLLDDKGVQAVIIAVPEHSHAPIATAAMQRGIHCYIEKPIVRRLEDAFKLRDLAKETKTVVQVGCQACSGDRWAKARAIIHSGELGTLLWSQGSYCRNSRNGEWNTPIDPDLNELTCDWDLWLGPSARRAFSPNVYFRWRKYAEYSSGIISDLLPHRLHPLMKALGPEFPTEVAALGTRNVQTDREVADTVHVLVEFPSGHTLAMVGSTANEQGMQDMIRGHKATMYLGGDALDVNPERPYVDELEPLSIVGNSSTEGHAAHEANFFQAVRGNEQPNCDIELAVSSDFGEAFDLNKGITVSARVKPTDSHSYGAAICLSINNSSTADLPGGSTHLWVGWALPDTVRLRRDNHRLRELVPTVDYNRKWCVWTLAAKRIGRDVA